MMYSKIRSGRNLAFLPTWSFLRSSICCACVLLGLEVGGCFSVDASLIGDSGQAQPHDSGAGDVDADTSDAAAPADDGGIQQADAAASAEGGDTLPDGDTAPVVLPDGDTAPVVIDGCDKDAQCADDEFCAVSPEAPAGTGAMARRVCAPRCSEERGCLLAEVDGRISDLATLDGALVILTAATRDSLGNSRNDQRILRWERPAAPVTLLRGACEYLVHVTQTHVFCLAANKLLRLLTTGGTADADALGEDEVDRHWATSTYLWWSTRRGDARELWRVGLSGTQVPERVSADASRSWLAVSDEAVYYDALVTAGADLVLFVQSLSLTDEPRNLGVFYDYQPYSLADAEALYYTTSYDSCTVRRTPRDGGPTTTLSNQDSCYGSFQVSGELLYWQCASFAFGGAGNMLHIGRNTVAPPGEPQVLLQAPVALPYGAFGSETSFAVLEHSLVYIHPDDGRLFEVSF